MKWKVMAKTVATISALLGIKEIPIKGEGQEMDLSAEQRQKIVDALGEKMADEAIKGINSEIKKMAQVNLDIKAIQDEIDAMVKISALTEEELKEVAKDENGKPDTVALLQAIGKKQEEQASILEKLINEPEGDKAIQVIKNNMGEAMKHSATHLFGSGKAYDAFDGGREWNARMRDGGMVATDFNKSGVIPTLQNDVAHFVEENTGILNSLFNDFAELPAEWDRRTGVLDRVSDGYIIPGEIVQGRSKGWAPKNKFKIAAESGQVYRKKIDITFDGFELQEIENTWIRGYNKEGSHPWKKSFVGFLLIELVKRQKLDDRSAQINGIFVEGPGGDIPGAAVNSQNGLRYLWYHFRDVKKQYRAFDVGVPTESNIVDYIDNMISLIPETERKEQGMEIQLSSRWLKAYQKRAGELYPKLYSTDQGKMAYSLNSPIDYPNFIFQELKDQTKTDFIGITASKNVQILDYDASEKGKFTIVNDKRDTHIFADYRLGIRLRFVGTKLAEGDPREFEMQKVWSNNVPVFGKETFVPAFDIDNSGILKITFNSIAIDENWKTNITSIEGATPGTVVRIKGNSAMAAPKNLVDAGKLDLTEDFNLASGGTITLFVQENGDLKEISRTTAPETAVSTDIEFTAAALDVKGGTVFRFAGSADTTITSIINGVEGKSIKIYGDESVTNDLIVSDATGINVASTATLKDGNDFIQLTMIDGTWTETGRSITV